MNKIRIIDNVVGEMNKMKGNPSTNTINPSLIYTEIFDKHDDWIHIVMAMQNIEKIFAIPPIILTPYINIKILYKEDLYNLINPLKTTVNQDQLKQYIFELKSLGIGSTLSKYDFYLYTQYPKSSYE